MYAHLLLIGSSVVIWDSNPVRMNVRYHPVHYNEMICSIGSLRIYFIVYRISEYVSLPVRMYRPVSYICLKHNCRIRSMYVYLIIHLSLQPITWYYMSVANRSLHLSEWMVGRIYVSTIRCTSSWFIYYFNLLNDMYLPTHVSLLVQKNEMCASLLRLYYNCQPKCVISYLNLESLSIQKNLTCQ